VFTGAVVAIALAAVVLGAGGTVAALAFRRRRA